ncbi:MAG: FHA domain-containing protein [Verrucomicrobiota bacterium]
MPWKCPQCGNDNADSAVTCVFGCGYVKFPPGVVFVSDVTGKEIQARIPTTFGATALKTLGDSEIKYVSSEQFKLEKRIDQGGWAIINTSWATNPLFLNGSPIPPEGIILKHGDKLSIKDKFFRLTIRLIS